MGFVILLHGLVGTLLSAVALFDPEMYRAAMKPALAYFGWGEIPAFTVKDAWPQGFAFFMGLYSAVHLLQGLGISNSVAFVITEFLGAAGLFFIAQRTGEKAVLISSVSMAAFGVLGLISLVITALCCSRKTHATSSKKKNN